MNIEKYWEDVLHKDENAMRTYFNSNAQIRWHNTNEQFTVEEFIRANCEYPGAWSGEMEIVIYSEDHIVTAIHVYSNDQKNHFHAISFIQVNAGKIISIDEYWGDDSKPPQWRKELKIGCPIK